MPSSARCGRTAELERSKPFAKDRCEDVQEGGNVSSQTAPRSSSTRIDLKSLSTRCQALPHMHLFDVLVRLFHHFTWYHNRTGQIAILIFTGGSRVFQTCRDVFHIVQSALRYSFYYRLEAHSVNFVVYDPATRRVVHEVLLTFAMTCVPRHPAV